MNIKKDILTGNIINNISILYMVKKNGRFRTWKCICHCGNSFEAQTDSPARFLVKSCGCLMKGKNNPCWKGHGGLNGRYFNIIKSRCKTNNFDLTLEFLWSLFLQQNKKCALSGLDISIKTGKMTASLDRIDSSKGYTMDNVQWLHKHVNHMKNKYNQEYFLDICNRIVLYGKNR